MADRIHCCDLLSFFDLLIFTTTWVYTELLPVWLWFAFILWFTDIYHNKIRSSITPDIVVICFHSLIYWYLPQPVQHFLNTPSQLWFAFILWFTDIYHNYSSKTCEVPLVVICFHSLIYWYLPQPTLGIRITRFRLWFAFILWFTDIYHNLGTMNAYD